MTTTTEYSVGPTPVELLWARLTHELAGAYVAAVHHGDDTAPGLALACEILRGVDAATWRQAA